MQQRQKQLSILGILILLGVSQTGCAIVNQFSPSQALTHSVTETNKSTAVTPPASSVKNRAGTTSQSHHANSATSAPSTVTYPSFGLGVTGPEVLALNERLAELGYLPLIVSSSTIPAITLSNLNAPPNVTFQWRYGNVPSQVTSQWIPDTYTEMTRAAVIAVEHVNGLGIDGIVGPAVWQAILGANARQNPNPYTFVLVTKNPAPEEIHVWQDGKWVYQSIANTGVAAAPSTDGTFAVYERFLSQTMRGTNPNGTKYSDPGVPYVNYYDGSEAIHGFPRASYGFPQSVGCVELPISHAKTVWSLLHYGTLVTVEGHYNYSGASVASSTPSSSPAQSAHNNSSGTTNPTGKSTSGTSASGSSASQASGSSGNTVGQSGSTAGNTTGTSTGSTSGNTTGNTTGNTAPNNTAANSSESAGNSTSNIGNATSATNNATGNSTGNVTITTSNSTPVSSNSSNSSK